MERKRIATFTIHLSIDTSVAALMTSGADLCRREDEQRLTWEMRSQKSNHLKGGEK